MVKRIKKKYNTQIRRIFGQHIEERRQRQQKEKIKETNQIRIRYGRMF